VALPLKTPRLEIREIEPGDLSAVHACVSDPFVARWFPWGPNTEGETRAFLERAIHAATVPHRESFVLAVVVLGGGLVGVCFLDRSKGREFELGYYLRRDQWGQGFATESVKAVVSFAVSELGAHRVLARVDPGNPASARVVENAAFRLESQRERFIKGEWRESLAYVLLADECATSS
jgi:ribosomal-protein-alanine N-acetyltransferase